MNLNDKLNGFTVTRVEPIENGRAIEMSHDRSGARLLWLDNHEENKLFSISFKTVPSDDTGVFHILEHSVLGGSEKYPAKEPFVYMLKSSMNTFLNAMTFPDKTMFPISSRNHRDFMNLTEVYLDAVFKPLIYTQPNIFYQEGHHISWHGGDEKPSYKGVVFNEMKGVLSTVEEQIETEMLRLLYPDTCYRFVSGGHPESIPDLTNEQFVEAHRYFYHPSNSYIYLDGDIEIKPVLALCDRYLSEYERTDDLPEIAAQSPINPAEKRVEYELSPDESEEDNVYIAIGKVISDHRDRERAFAYPVICEALAGSNDAPFSRAVLDTGLCLDVDLSFSDGILQPFGVLTLRNLNESDGDALLAEVERILTEMVTNGISREHLNSAINRIEFRFLESEEPKGISRAIDAMSSWLYGGDPLYYIECGEIFDSLRSKVDSGYFEELVREWLLDEEGRGVLRMIPSKTLGEEKLRAEQERCENELSAMSDDERAELIRMNENIDNWQNTPDSPEAIATIPSLPLSEVSSEPIRFVTDVTNELGFDILRHPPKNSGISAMNLYFDISDFTDEELETAVYIDHLVAELPTFRSSGAELQQRITGILGSITTTVMPISPGDDASACKVWFAVRSRFLTRNFKAAQELIAELITETDYSDMKPVCELLKQDAEDEKQAVIASGNRVAAQMAQSGMTAEFALAERLNGFGEYRRLRELVDAAEERIPKLIEDMTSLAKKIFCRARLTASITSTDDLIPDILAKLLPEGEKPTRELIRPQLGCSEAQAVIIPSGVSYAAMSLDCKITDKGLWNVISRLLTYEYLWNEVRLKGGAYGTGFVVSAVGSTAFTSYRDPSPAASIATYSNAADFLESYCDSDSDLEQYIIGTIAQGEPLRTDGEYGSACDSAYLRGITHEYRRELRRRMLTLTKDDLRTALPDLGKTGCVCIVGSKDAVSAYTDKELTVYTLA